MAGRERVQKLLARAGLGSRRTCETFISAGRVTIDGVVARLGDRADPEHQEIALDGVPVVVRTDLVYYLLNKPPGVVTTARDPQGRPTVVALVPDDPRVFTVGRLDVDTEGLLLLTNDGDLGQLLAHPRHGVEKTYLVQVDGDATEGACARLRAGVELEDGMTAPARVRVVSRARERSALEISIHEGRKRQVRRMCAAVGLPVTRLVRTRIGPLADTRLAPGAWRHLTPIEIRALYQAAHSSPGHEQTSH
jgi:23S rRNA pseudouridine2605 synthase